MMKNNLAVNIEEYQIGETLRFLRDSIELHKLCGDKCNLDKSLYFVNYPKEDFN